jgi:hypothetical protein
MIDDIHGWMVGGWCERDLIGGKQQSEEWLALRWLARKNDIPN